jgi:hypothetical protein
MAAVKSLRDDIGSAPFAASKLATVQSSCTLPIPHHAYLLPVPIEIRPHVGTALAAFPTGEALLDIGQPDSIGPAIAADRD